MTVFVIMILSIVFVLLVTDIIIIVVVLVIFNISFKLHYFFYSRARGHEQNAKNVVSPCPLCIQEFALVGILITP